MTDQKAIAIFTGLKMMVGTEAKEACDVAISALQEREERSKGCRFCFDATLEPDLEGCDLSYHYVGESEQKKRIMIRSGNGKPMADYSGPLAHPGRSLAQLDRASAHSTRSAVQPMLAADQHTC